MKKSLVMLVVLVSSLALAGTVMAGYDWGCFEMPVVKQECYDTALCKGQAKGAVKLCGPCGPCCAPVITYSGSWLTVARCPVAPKAPAKGPESIMPPDFKKLTVAPVCGVAGCAVAAKPISAKASKGGDKAAKPAKKDKKK
jgi:hypothetical protein